jgi:hypothetical protein
MENSYGMFFVLGATVSGWLIDDMVWTQGIRAGKYLRICPFDKGT